MLPELAKETKEICKRLNIEDVNETNISSKEFSEGGKRNILIQNKTLKTE